MFFNNNINKRQSTLLPAESKILSKDRHSLILLTSSLLPLRRGWCSNNQPSCSWQRCAFTPRTAARLVLGFQGLDTGVRRTVISYWCFIANLQLYCKQSQILLEPSTLAFFVISSLSWIETQKLWSIMKHSSLPKTAAGGSLEQFQSRSSIILSNNDN